MVDCFHISQTGFPPTSTTMCRMDAHDVSSCDSAITRGASHAKGFWLMHGHGSKQGHAMLRKTVETCRTRMFAYFGFAQLGSTLGRKLAIGAKG
jgi:hypothetical protein